MNPSSNSTSRPNSGGGQGEQPARQNSRQSAPLLESSSDESQVDNRSRKRPHPGYARLPIGESAGAAGDIQIEPEPITAGLVFSFGLANDVASYSPGAVGAAGGIHPASLSQGELGMSVFPSNYFLPETNISPVSPESPLNARSFFPVDPEQHQEEEEQQHRLSSHAYFQPTARDALLSPNEQIEQHQSPWDLKLDSPLSHHRRKSAGVETNSGGLEIHSVPIHFNREKARRRESFMSDPGKQEWDSQPAMETAGYATLLTTTKKSPRGAAKSAVAGATTGGSQKKRLIDNSTFPIKLHGILSSPDCSPSIHWLPEGKAWRVVNPLLFEQEVLPRYFRSARYASFMRQVNGWGFKRISSGPDQNSYYNDNFIRGRPELCSKMERVKSDRRKPPPKKEPKKKPEKPASYPDEQPEPSVPAIVSVRRNLKPASPHFPQSATSAKEPKVLLRTLSQPASSTPSQKNLKHMPRSRSYGSLGSSCLGSWEDSVGESPVHGDEASAPSDLLEPVPLSGEEPLSPRFSSALGGLLLPNHEQKPNPQSVLAPAPATDSSLNNTQLSQGMTRHSS